MTKIAHRSAFGVLAGLSILMAGVGAANAATVTIPESFNATPDFQPHLLFPQFAPSLGSLDQVVFSLANPTGAIPILVITFHNSSPTQLNPFIMANDELITSGTDGEPPATLADYTGNGPLGVSIVLRDSNGNNLAGSNTVILSYDFTTSSAFTSSSSATPLPATLPLFATGLGGLGLFGWRRKRKPRASLLLGAA